MPEELKELLKSYLESQSADGYLFSGPISTHTADEIVSVIERQEERRPNACFFLTTGGGDPHCAYRIGRTLKRHYGDGNILFLFGGYCKSAGTLLALCAKELVFSTFGELGPLDVQIGKLNELVGADSGLDLNQSLEQLAATAFKSFETQLLGLVRKSQGAISTKVAAGIATELTIGLFSPIAAQIDPLRMGVSWRSNQIGLRYGQQLASENVVDGTVDRLVNFYPTHGFVIDEVEASEMFNQVRHANDREQQIFEHLSGVLREPNGEATAIILSLRTDLENDAERKRADDPTPEHLEPTTASDTIEGSEPHEIEPIQTQKPNGAEHAS